MEKWFREHAPNLRAYRERLHADNVYAKFLEPNVYPAVKLDPSVILGQLNYGQANSKYRREDLFGPLGPFDSGTHLLGALLHENMHAPACLDDTFKLLQYYPRGNAVW